MAVYLGVDFGTRGIKICQKGKGIVLREPNVAAVDTEGNVIAVGTEALLIRGRAPGTVTVRRPILDGNITDFNLAAEILDHCLEIAAPRAKKHILAAAKYGLGSRNRELLQKALSDCRTGQVELVDSAPLSLLGSGFTPAEDEAEALSGTIICDIGAGSVEASYIRAGELLRTETAIGAGDAADAGIVSYIRRNYGLAITQNSAREAKHKLSLYGSDDQALTFTGVDSSTGMPRRIEIAADALLECCTTQIDGAADTIAALINNLPRCGEDSSSVDRIIIVGGGAKLPGIGEYIEKSLGLTITVADEPLDCTVNGLSRMLNG
ncbi:MAG: rod shape-determining protein [Clostridia bacterium]|nr:rod shape-determining protein [Clostridia bacterium]